MGIPHYLAMTAAEFRGCAQLPAHAAWMACHFSPYGTGLTNLPASLPEGSLLILNDRTPVHGHNAGRIFDQLTGAIEVLKSSGLLLDLQRGSEEAPAIVQRLLALPCPVIVSDTYARELDCPVFLPPVPLRKTVEEHIEKWKGREIWLDTALDGEVVTVTEKGSTAAPLPLGETPECPLTDKELHCRYRIDLTNDRARFTLRRTLEDIENQLADAEKYHITAAVGLWQELGRTKPSPGGKVAERSEVG